MFGSFRMKSWGVVGFVGLTCNSQGRSQPLLAVSERPSSPGPIWLRDERPKSLIFIVVARSSMVFASSTWRSKSANRTSLTSLKTCRSLRGRRAAHPTLWSTPPPNGLRSNTSFYTAGFALMLRGPPFSSLTASWRQKASASLNLVA